MDATVRYPAIEADPNAGAIRVLRSTCRMCHGGCSTLVEVHGGRIQSIKGDPDGPLNHGRLCPMGAASVELVHSPARLTHPLIRAGERGSGQWQRASWDEALELICARIRDIWSRYGREGIALAAGTGRHHCNFVPRFANQLGTPNWCEPGTAQCFFPRVNTMNLTFGGMCWSDYRGERMPGVLLFWGHNPLVSSPDGEVGFMVRDALATRPATIVVDPRRTRLAREADIHLQLRPATDDALALAMLHVIITEDLYHHDFVTRWTFGFDRLAGHIRQFTPEWAEPITWVPAEKIRAAARLWAAAQPGALEWGAAIEHTPSSVQTIRAISMLPALTGAIDVPGGWCLGMNGLAPFPFLAEVLPEEQRRKRLGAERFRMLGGEGATAVPSAHIAGVFESMRTGQPYWTKGLLVFGGNPLATYADTRLVHESLQQLDFLLVAELFMTPTAELADVVLPVAGWPEVNQIVGMPYFGEDVVLAQQQAEQIGECRQDEVIFAELARRLELPHAGETPEDVFNQQLAPLGITYRELVERGPVQLPMRYHKYETGGFRTPTGKIELYSTRLEALGYSPLPTFSEPPESPFSTPELAQDYPYILITGARTPVFFHSEYRQLPKLRRARPEPQVEMHPETAAKHGIGRGDWVVISSPRGRIRQRALITGDIDPRVIHCQHAWWFPERPGWDHGIFESNANLLTSQAEPYDPAMGTYQLRGLLCAIARE